MNIPHIPHWLPHACVLAFGLIGAIALVLA